MIKHCLLLIVFVFAACAFAQAIDDTQLPNPMRNVKVGQWTYYKINTLFGFAEQKQTVTKITGAGDDRIVTIKSEMVIENELVDEKEEAFPYARIIAEQAEALADATDVKIVDDELQLNGNKIPCVRVDFTQDGQRGHLYLSDNVPLTGVIRLQIDDVEEPIMQLMDFGEE